MLEVTKTVNVSGYSRIAESDAPYVYFSASISADGKRSVNYSVQNQEILMQMKKRLKQTGRNLKRQLRRWLNMVKQEKRWGK